MTGDKNRKTPIINIIIFSWVFLGLMAVLFYFVFKIFQERFQETLWLTAAFENIVTVIAPLRVPRDPGFFFFVGFA